MEPNINASEKQIRKRPERPPDDAGGAFCWVALSRSPTYEWYFYFGEGIGKETRFFLTAKKPCFFKKQGFWVFVFWQNRVSGITVAIAKKPLGDAPRLVANYGGLVEDWYKISSNQSAIIDGAIVEIHWFKNNLTGQNVEYKIKRTYPKTAPKNE